jgi:NADH:ubiquinone oxidoreductase subunit 6 (subunit J)
VTVLALVVWTATRDFAPSLVWDREDHGVGRLGQVLINKYLLPLEIASLTLFLVIIGAGVITRPERKENS